MKTAFFIGLIIAPLLPAQETQQVIVGSRTRGANVQTFEFVGGQILGGKPVKGMPYSAEAITQTTQTLADGSHIVNSTSSMFYRDSEGRERREESIGKLGAWSAQGQPAKAVFISDPVANVSYSLDATAHIARKMPLMASRLPNLGMGPISIRASMITPPPGGAAATTGPNVVFFSTSGSASGGGEAAPKVEHLGASVIEGITAEGTRTTVTIPAGQIGNERDINIVSERWYSPELQVVVMSKHSDPRIGETTYKLTNLNRSEPLPSMFQVPPDYTVTDSKMQPLPPLLPKEDNQQ